MTEEGPNVLASSFAYGLNYLHRTDALEVDPVSLSLRDRDAAPDSWGRRVIEAKLKVPANSQPESQYLLHAGGDRVGTHDRRTQGHAPPPLRPLLDRTGQSIA